jgi:hypothetical protein
MARKSRVSAPSRGLWVVALILGILGVIVHLRVLPALSQLNPYDFWLIAAGWLALVIGTSLRGI